MILFTSCTGEAEEKSEKFHLALLNELQESKIILNNSIYNKRTYLEQNKIDTMQAFKIHQVCNDYSSYIQFVFRYLKSYEKKEKVMVDGEKVIFHVEDTDYKDRKKINRKFFKSDEWGDYSKIGEEYIYKAFFFVEAIKELSSSQYIRDKAANNFLLYDYRYDKDIKILSLDHIFRDMSVLEALVYISYKQKEILELENDMLYEIYLKDLEEKEEAN